AYQPENLKGLKVVVVANLKPRKMKFGISEAMLLASGEGESLSLFIPHKDAKPGDKLK
ncbi:tRNA binding domain protein, partial [Leptospira interrogans str. FPW1039]